MIFAFSIQKAEAHHLQVTWDGMELKKGQIGSVHVNNSTKIYSYINNKLVYYQTAKAKTKYRVYKINDSTKTYSIGSSHYFKIDDKKITYKAVPKSLFNQVNIVH